MNNLYKTCRHIINTNSTAPYKHILRWVAYKSSISLKNIYPNSTLKITVPTEPVHISKPFSGFIPLEELEISYSRSTGPGGQNVNKVNTKVDLRFHVQSASWINDEIKSKLLEKYATKINKEGYLIFRSDLTRSQQLNLADCLEKVRTAIRTAIATNPEPSEQTLEKVRRSQEKAARERLILKRQRSNVKSDRQAPHVLDL